MQEIEQLEQAIAALEAQRALLGDAVVEAGLAPMRARLAQLRSAQPSAEQRKQVTVLFADVSGFTALSETLDPEEITEIINALWQRLDTAITRYGGTIDKHIGDAVMALWGVEMAREDEPERAVRAALAMQAELRDFAQSHGHPLKMRIGVNTGPVLLSTVGTVGEFTAMGDTVNLASRMEHAAPVGGILIAHDTYRQVRGLFNMQALEPILVKGKAEPVRVYMVDSLKPRGFRGSPRGVEGVETRMVGRLAELKQLQERFEQVTSAGVPQMVTVVGDAGVGKSRLLYEFEQWLDLLVTRVRYFKGRATQRLQATPYGLLRDMIAFRFEIMESDSAAIVRQKLERGVSGFLGAEQQASAHVLGAWLGYDFAGSPHLAGLADDARQLHDRALACLGELFASATRAAPAVLLAEDIHWADESSLEVLRYLLGRPGLRVLILCLSRPSLFEQRTIWGQPAPGELRLDLRRLSAEDSRLLAGEILRKAEHVPETLYALIVERAEGNPFYIEELIKMLIDDRIILTGDEPWRIELERLDLQRVPPTLTGVLQARLDSLQPPEKLTLQRASVVGRVFWEQALASLEPPGQRPTALDEALGGLYARELVFPREQSAFEETSEYIFKHALLRDVTYESVLRRERRAYHAQVARWLTEVSARSGRADEYAALIAEHCAEAGEYAAAAHWHQLAGEKSQSLYALPTAIDHFTRALAALEQVRSSAGASPAEAASAEPALPAPQQIYRARGLAHETLGDFERARADYQSALDAARARADQRAEWRSLLDLGLLWAGRDYSRTGDYYRQALEPARQLGDQAALATTLNRMGNWCVNTNQLAEARRYHEEALAISRALGDPRGLAETLDLYGMMNNLAGDFVLTRAAYLEALELFRRLGDPQGLIAIQSSLLVTLTTFDSELCVLPDGSLAELLPGALEALQRSREIGWRSSEAFIGFLLAFVLGGHGEYGAALQHGAEALKVARQIEHLQWITGCLTTQGMLYQELDLLAHAQSQLDEALALSQQIGSTVWLFYITGTFAELHTAQGNYEQAERLLNLGDPDFAATPQSSPQRTVRAARAELALARGQPQQALELIDGLIACAYNLTSTSVIPRLWRLRAQALIMLGREAEAEQLLLAAHVTAAAQGSRPQLWRIDRELAALYASQGRAEQARARREAAATMLDQLAQTLSDQQLREQYLRAALATLPEC